MLRVVGAAALSALLLWAASPAGGAGWLAWVALVPVAAVTLGASEPRARRLAVPLTYSLYLELLLAPAFPFGLAEGQWGDAALPVMVDDSPVLFIALLAVPLFGALLYALRFGEPWGAARLPAPWASLACVLVPALAWMGLDLVRAKLDPGGFWGPLFLSQSDAAGADLAALGGPWAITFAIVAVNYSLALALVRRHPAPAVAAAGALIAVVAVAPIASPDPRPVGAITVGVVQPGYDTAESDRPVLRNFAPGSWDRAALDVVGDLDPLTRRAAADGAELIVWPEAVMYVDPRREPRVISRLRRLARATKASLVIPFFLPRPDISAAIVVGPAGGVSAPRAKQRPMWYLGEGDASAGGPEPLQAAGLRLGVLLGIDTQDPRIAAEYADRGASLLVSATHDWRQLATQHRAYSRLGALGAGIPVVRADWRYGSAIYGPEREIAADAGGDLRRTVLTATVLPAAGSTPYSSLGDALGWGALALSAVARLGSIATRRRTRELIGEPRKRVDVGLPS